MENISTLFLIAGLLGIIFIITGFLMYKFPPKKINPLYGYRTRQSMSSQEKWDFAQKFSSKLMFKSGVLLLVIGFLSFFINVSETVAIVIGIGSMFAVIIYLFFTTEKQLKLKFDAHEAL